MRPRKAGWAGCALAAIAAFGLSGCADGSTNSPLGALVTAMRNAHAGVPAPVERGAAPAALVAEAAPAPTSAPAPALRPAAAVSMANRAPASAPGSPDVAALQRQLDQLESRVSALTAENQRQMEQLSLMTNGAIADMERLFSSLRLELRAAPASEPSTPKRRRPSPAAGAMVPSGQGGPFLPWPPKASAGPVASLERAEPLLPELEKLFLLHQIALALPLSPPLDQTAVVTGPFGYRRDPFNRRSAFHDGIDLQAPMRTPVHATAAGTVIVAGVRPAYGRVVEIDHAFGIHTRYAHLSSLAVREGERVTRHALVGGLGSSGRSASPHLHYEVLFNGRPHDPAGLLTLADAIRALP